MCCLCSEYLCWTVHGSHNISVSQAALASFDTFITAVCILTTSKKTLVIVLCKTCYSRAWMDSFIHYTVTVVTRMHVIVKCNWTVTANEACLNPTEGI